MHKLIAILVFVVGCGFVLATVIVSASIRDKNFYDCFGIEPGASEQPQAQSAVLRKLLILRSQYKESARREIELVKTIEDARDSIAGGGSTNMASRKRLAEILKEYAGLPELKKKTFSSYFDACEMARKKEFNESADLAGCKFVSSVDVGELGNQVAALQMK